MALHVGQCAQGAPDSQQVQVPRQEGELVLDSAFEGLGDVDAEVAVGVEADFAARGPPGMAPVSW